MNYCCHVIFILQQRTPTQHKTRTTKGKERIQQQEMQIERDCYGGSGSGGPMIMFAFRYDCFKLRLGRTVDNNESFVATFL